MLLVVFPINPAKICGWAQQNHLKGKDFDQVLFVYFKR